MVAIEVTWFIKGIKAMKKTQLKETIHKFIIVKISKTRKCENKRKRKIVITGQFIGCKNLL